jgi:hypothetical protein
MGLAPLAGVEALRLEILDKQLSHGDVPVVPMLAQ